MRNSPEGKPLSQRKQPAPFWQRFDINQIEDLGNAVLGAELEAVQMAGPPARGSLAFAASDGVIFSTGLIRGRVAVRGQLSREAMTLAVGLRLCPGSRLWLNPVTDGEVGVFLPGEACDALLTEGSLYFAANLSEERLEEEAAREELALDRRTIACSGLHSKPIARQSLVELRESVARVHSGATVDDDGVSRAVLRTVIEHYARSPTYGAGRADPIGHAKIVHRAQEFIRANLDGPISRDAIAMAAETSRSTLARAFREILGETPADHVRRLRLHRIRRDLIRGEGSGRSIHEIAAAWGIGEPGRMAGWYRNLFGEYPRDTLSLHSRRRRRGVAL